MKRGVGDRYWRVYYIFDPSNFSIFTTNYISEKSKKKNKDLSFVEQKRGKKGMFKKFR